jgi:hypothetical protein
MIEVLRRFIEAEGDTYVASLLLEAIRLGSSHTFNLDVFDVQIDSDSGMVTITDILCPGDFARITTDELRNLALAILGTE